MSVKAIAKELFDRFVETPKGEEFMRQVDAEASAQTEAERREKAAHRKKLLETMERRALEIHCPRIRALETQRAKLQKQIDEITVELTTVESVRSSECNSGHREADALEREIRASCPTQLTGFETVATQRIEELLRARETETGKNIEGRLVFKRSNHEGVEAAVASVRKALAAVRALALEPLSDAEIVARVAKFREQLPELASVSLEKLGE